MKTLIDSSALVVILGAFLGGIVFDFCRIKRKRKELILFDLISIILLSISLGLLKDDSEALLVVASTFCWELIKDIKETENNLARKISFSFAAFYVYLGIAYVASPAILGKINEVLSKSDKFLNWTTSYGLMFLGGLIFFITNKMTKRVPILKQEEITIKLNSETTKAYQATSEEKKRKIAAFLNF